MSNIENKVTVNNIKNNLLHVAPYNGDIWFVSSLHGSDTNTGKEVCKAFKTIGKAIIAMSAGDAISLGAGIYTEIDLDLSKDYTEMWFEIGAIIAPATGSALTSALIVSGDYCKIKGNHIITPIALSTGITVSGNEAVISDGKVSGGANGITVTGLGATFKDYVAGLQTAISWDIQGPQGRYFECGTVGVGGATYGFKIGAVAVGILRSCTSSGHGTSGFYVGTGATGWTIINCSTGGSDGKWVDVDDTTVWSGFTYPETKYKRLTLNNSHTYDIFKITGVVEVQEIYGHVTTDLVGANTSVHLNFHSASADIVITNAAGTDIGAAVEGTILMKADTLGSAIKVFPGGTLIAGISANSDKKPVGLGAYPLETSTIQWKAAGDTSGVIDWHVVWRPLTEDGFLEPA